MRNELPQLQTKGLTDTQATSQVASLASEWQGSERVRFRLGEQKNLPQRKILRRREAKTTDSEIRVAKSLSSPPFSYDRKNSEEYIDLEGGS